MRRFLSFLPVLLLLIVFPEVGKTLDDVRRSLGRALWGEDRGRWAELGVPRAGEERIPEDARGMIHLLRASECTEYSLSDGWKRRYAYQRIVEGAWPIRHRSEAPCRGVLPEESQGCRVRERGAHGVVADCR
jgi:hypothetical protein